MEVFSVSISILFSTYPLPFVLHKCQHLLPFSPSIFLCSMQEHVLPIPVQRCHILHNSMPSTLSSSVFRSSCGLSLPYPPDLQHSHLHKCFARHSPSPDHSKADRVVTHRNCSGHRRRIVLNSQLFSVLSRLNLHVYVHCTACQFLGSCILFTTMWLLISSTVGFFFSQSYCKKLAHAL